MSESISAELPCVLAVDIGTSSVRAYLYDRAGRNLGGAKIRYAWRMVPAGGVETDADELLGRTADAIDGAVAVARDSGVEVAAVGVATFWHGLVGADADGTAVTPVYAWSDTRASAAAGELRRRLDEAAVQARTGAVFHSSYLPARLLWLSRAEPARFARARYWLSMGEYLALHFFGERAASLSMASGTGMLDRSAARWDDGLLRELPIAEDQLSPLVDLDRPFAGLVTPYAGRWPGLREVPWLPAIGDGAAANVGNGCTSPERIALSLGTSGALRVLAREGGDGAALGLWRYLLDRERVLVGGAISNGGSVSAWMFDRLRLPAAAEAETALRAMPPDGHGLTLLPFFAGGRSPDWPLDATAAIAGATQDTTPLDLLQAGLEAVAYQLARIRDLLADRFPGARDIVASGGALVHLPVWARIIADVFGEPLLLSSVRESTCRGAALVALESIGAIDDVASAPIAEATRIEPDAFRHARYRRARARQAALGELLAGWPERG